MKKFSLGLLTVFVLLLSLTVTAFAAHSDEDLGTVDYNGSKLIASSDFANLNDILSGLEPGDSVEFTVTLKNSGDKDMDFWMSNEAIQSFEDNGKASGGAYTYILRYNGTDLYNNEQVGGDEPDDGKGLHEATGALEDFFFLQTLSKGQSGKVTLYVALDGPTQGNDYQDALSKINLTFAVEEHGNENVIIKTGDTMKTLPFFIAAGAAGIAIIVLIVIRARKSRKGGEQA